MASSPTYDVFLNFRGEDVRFNFLSYLILAFNHLSLNFFVDYKLKRGEHIKSALMEAIQDSKVALTIFSKGYASSSWCLDELVKIMECRESAKRKQKVLPVFYHVTPSDVRNVQSGVFAQDFTKHESDHRSRNKVPRWKASMEAAGDLSGRIVNKTSWEAHVLIEIVDDVLTSLGRNYSMSNRGDDNSDRALFHHSIRTQLPVFLHNQKGKLKDWPNIQQQQRNVSIWTISRREGLYVKELNTILKSIEVQAGGKPPKSHSNQSETSSSHPSPLISYCSGTTIRKMAGTTAPTKSTLTNSSFGSGGGNNINGVNSYGLGSTTVPTSSVTQVGLPMSSSGFASGGGNNTNGSGISLRRLGPDKGVSSSKWFSEQIESSEKGISSSKWFFEQIERSEKGVFLSKCFFEQIESLEKGVCLSKWFFEQIESPEKGVSLSKKISEQIETLKTGVSLSKRISEQIESPEKSVSLSKRIFEQIESPEKGVSLSKKFSKQIENLEKGVSLSKRISEQIESPEKGVSLSNRIKSPENGVSLSKRISEQIESPEKGVSLSKKFSKQIESLEKGVSLSKSISEQIKSPEKGVSLSKSISKHIESPENGISLSKKFSKQIENLEKGVSYTGYVSREWKGIGSNGKEIN